YNSRLPACLLRNPPTRGSTEYVTGPQGVLRRRRASTRRPGSLSLTGRSFVTETRQDPDLRRLGADVQSITDALIAQAAAEGGRLSSEEVGERLKSTELTAQQSKKVIKALADADALADPPARAPQVVAARSTATARATTARVPEDGAEPTSEVKPASSGGSTKARGRGKSATTLAAVPGDAMTAAAEATPSEATSSDATSSEGPTSEGSVSEAAASGDAGSGATGSGATAGGAAKASKAAKAKSPRKTTKAADASEGGEAA